MEQARRRGLYNFNPLLRFTSGRDCGVSTLWWMEFQSSFEIHEDSLELRSYVALAPLQFQSSFEIHVQPSRETRHPGNTRFQSSFEIHAGASRAAARRVAAQRISILF